MPDDTTPQRCYSSRQKLMQARVHRNESGNFCIDQSGAIESFLIDSEIVCEDRGDEITLYENQALFEKTAASDVSIRVIRAFSSRSVFAPKSGYRLDGPYKVVPGERWGEDSNGKYCRLILLKAQEKAALPIREPFQSVVKLCENLGYSCSIEGNGVVSGVVARSRFGIVVHIQINIHDGARVYLYFRLDSWSAEGDRTDWHDILPTALAVFLRIHLGKSCSLFDQINPAVPVPPAELYGRYIVLDQSGDSPIQLTTDGFHEVEKILGGICRFETIFPAWFDWAHKDGKCDERFSYEEAEHWADLIRRAVGGEPDTDKDVYNARWHPDWTYYRNIYARISVIESTAFSEAIKSLLSLSSPTTIAEKAGSFVILEQSKNFISSYAKKKVSGICRRLQRPSFDIEYVPLENALVAIAPPYLIIYRRDCGIHAFNHARDSIRERHHLEHQFLFPPMTYLWSQTIDDDQFEELVLELLSVEYGIARARRTGTSRDADQGRDIIIDWQTIPLSMESNIHSGALLWRRVIGQCKASSKSIGKAEVRDIRDTVEHHSGTGYFLAVSSVVTNDLAAHLDTLKERGGIWTEWWTRSEIETRLRKNPEIAARFQGIVRPVISKVE